MLANASGDRAMAITSLDSGVCGVVRGGGAIATLQSCVRSQRPTCLTALSSFFNCNRFSGSSGHELRTPATLLSCRCIAQPRDHEGSITVGKKDETQKNTFGISSLVAPLLAAALIGSVQPAVLASEWDQYLVSVDTETSQSDEAYKNLLKRIREKRGRGAQTAPVIENSNGLSSPLLSKEQPAKEDADAFGRVTRSAAETATFQTENNKKTKVEEVQPVFSKVEAVESKNVRQKTHGFMPLFLSQFLLLVAAIGGGYGLISTPQSTWDDAQKKVDAVVEKVTPVVEDAWAKAQPAAVQAQTFAKGAKPYVDRAWEVSKPIAAKAVEAAKPILRDAKVKASELIQQLQEKSKS